MSPVSVLRCADSASQWKPLFLHISALFMDYNFTITWLSQYTVYTESKSLSLYQCQMTCSPLHEPAHTQKRNTEELICHLRDTGSVHLFLTSSGPQRFTAPDILCIERKNTLFIRSLYRIKSYPVFIPQASSGFIIQ